MKPASPYVPADRATYHPTERCGQGPYRVEAPSVPAKFGEELLVYACGKHAVAGNYRYTTFNPDGTESKWSMSEGSFGYADAGNQACKAKDVAVVSGGESGTGRAAGSGGKSGARNVTTAAPTTIKSRSLEAGGAELENCDRVQIADVQFTTSMNDDPLLGRVVIDIWSDEPNDLEDLVFVVEHHVVRADMTVGGWQAYNDAYDAWYAAWKAHAEEDVHAGLATWTDMTVKTPPPPPARAETPPPRPSQHARWIAGYWLYVDTSFHWIPGLWDVPDEDIEKQLTVQAPTPPPSAPKTDAPTEARPTATAVWTPGSWQWDGHAYIWVAGAWRIPPDENHTWQAPSWAITAGRSVFRPGGWRVSVRLGR